MFCKYQYITWGGIAFSDTWTDSCQSNKAIAETWFNLQTYNSVYITSLCVRTKIIKKVELYGPMAPFYGQDWHVKVMWYYWSVNYSSVSKTFRVPPPLPRPVLIFESSKPFLNTAFNILDCTYFSLFMLVWSKRITKLSRILYLFDLVLDGIWSYSINGALCVRL